MSVRNAREGGGQLVEREHRGEVTGGEWRRDETVCVCRRGVHSTYRIALIRSIWWTEHEPNNQILLKHALPQ